MKTSNLIKHTYRITPYQDKRVKELSKHFGISENEFIRSIIEIEYDRIAEVTKKHKDEI